MGKIANVFAHFLRTGRTIQPDGRHLFIGLKCDHGGRKKLGDAAGLTQFGVNLSRLPAGTWSGQRHWHTGCDEFIYVVAGEVVLVSDDGEEILRAGDAAGFPAGDTDAHCFQNRSDCDVLILEIGTRFSDDIGHYPDIDLVARLDLLGFSGIANLIMSIKFAKYFELGPEDIILTVLTDSMELYQSRLREMRARFGEYTEADAIADFARYLQGLTTDHILELRYPDRKRIHNLKYFTWVEQQGKDVQELEAQWYDPHYWTRIQNLLPELDARIEEFNERVRRGA